jgi:CRISPR/Cas system-associated endonuclease/helicase Cas3
MASRAAMLNHGATQLLSIPPHERQSMSVPNSIHDYLRMFAGELGERILQSFPALHNAHDPVSPRLATLLRKPFPAQAVAAMGLAKKWERDRSAAVIAECGTGKTLISLAGLHIHSNGQPFTAIVMAPGHITPPRINKTRRPRIQPRQRGPNMSG